MELRSKIANSRYSQTLLFSWEWILKISGTLSLINLVSDLKSWRALIISTFHKLSDYLPGLAKYIGIVAHQIVVLSNSLIDTVFFFIPDQNRAVVSVAIISVIMILRVSITKKALSNDNLNSIFFLTAMFIVGAEGLFSGIFLFVGMVYGTSAVLNYDIASRRCDGVSPLKLASTPSVLRKFIMVLFSYILWIAIGPYITVDNYINLGSFALVIYPVFDLVKWVFLKFFNR